MEVTEAATGTAKESSLSFNLTNSTTNIDLSVNNSNGTFDTSATPVSFNISTTNYTGYTLSIKGTNNNQTLVNGTNSSYTLSSISTATESFNSTDYNNKWGYLPSKLNSSTNSKYQPAPTTTASTLDKTSSANSSVNTYTIGIGARASYTTPAGEYTGTYILTAVGNPINYTITYNKNTTDTVSSLPSNVDSSTSQTYITLSSDTPTRDGYTFLGWCLGTITTTNNVDSCTGTTYQPGNSFYIDQTTANAPTLLAMWQLDWSGPDMQNLASSSCVTSQATEVKDTRDGTIYRVQRLANGNCWLLDNLALDLVTYKDNITADNTNATTAQLNYLKNGGGTTSDQYAITGVSVWASSSSYASSYSYSDPLYQMSGNCSTSNKYCVTNTAGGSWSYTNTTGSANDGADKYPGKVGVYYNYCATTAGTYCYGNGTDYGSSASGNASADICPKGWRLPTGGSSGEFKALYDAYSSGSPSQYDAFRSALQVPLSGGFGNGVAGSQGSYGYFWSSTYNSTNNMYRLLVSTSNVNQASHFARYSGTSVRCVLSENISNITYMQQVNNNMVAKMTTGTTVTLKDNRDETSYKVGKLADGNLWLLENLALDLTSVSLDKLKGNTNATDTILGYLKNGGGSSPYPASGVSSVWTSTSQNSYVLPYIAKSGNCSDTTPTHCVNNPSSGQWVSTASTSTANDNADKYPGKVGIYYNYCAASAGSYCYGDGTTSVAPPTNTNASYDICPYGWRLPTGGGNGEFQALYSRYNNYDNFRSALQAPLSSLFYSGKSNNQGYNGFSWSSTYYNATNMHNLGVNTSNVLPAHNGGRYHGYSVRCIFAG